MNPSNRLFGKRFFAIFGITKAVRKGGCFALLCLLFSAAIPRASADNLFAIDFEDKSYVVGKLSGTMPHVPRDFRWEVMKEGVAEVQTDIVHDGERALRVGSAACWVRQRFYGTEGIARDRDGIQLLESAVHYYDFWVYPDCEPDDYIVVARLVDFADGKCYADIHFANGIIKVYTKFEGEKKPRYVQVEGEWESRKWNRVTLKIDGAAQKFELFLGGKPCMESPLLLPNKFSGMFWGVYFEGPHSRQEAASCYYDDLCWSDTNPLAAK